MFGYRLGFFVGAALLAAAAALLVMLIRRSEVAQIQVDDLAMAKA